MNVSSFFDTCFQENYLPLLHRSQGVFSNLHRRRSSFIQGPLTDARSMAGLAARAAVISLFNSEVLIHNIAIAFLAFSAALVIVEKLVITLSQ